MSDRWACIRGKARELAESAGIIGAAAVLMAMPVVRGAAARLDAGMRSLAAWWRQLDRGGKLRAVGWLVAALLLVYAWSWRDVPGNWLAYMRGDRPLYAARSWHYQLDKIDLDQLAKVKADVLVTDFAKMGGKVPLTLEEVSRLKINADGKPRLVLSYMAIGEAEQFRYYYKDDWKTDPPEWLGAENCAWPGAHKVKFWHDSWKDTIWRGRKSYLKKIIDAGFDGVYLDRVDIFDQFPDQTTARADMIGFVQDLSVTAKALKPGFLVVPQNADDLLVEPAYRAAIDGLGREDLLYGASGATGKRNDAADIAAAQGRLELLTWEWKPVFAVEYLQTSQAINDARRELLARGLVPTIQPRALDGTDPTAPIDLTKDVGTSEYVRENCVKGSAW